MLTEDRTSFRAAWASVYDNLRQPTISASISSLRCMRARAYSRGSSGYASGSGRGSEMEEGCEGAGRAIASS